MAKRIIIGLDGTGNEVKADSVTNVFKISELAAMTEPTPEQWLRVRKSSSCITAQVSARFRRRTPVRACSGGRRRSSAAVPSGTGCEPILVRHTPT